MAEERVPVFELHIVQMFRRIDRECMALREADLTSYDYVKANAQPILRKLRENNFPMPERHYGGPWPKEWIDLFERWTQDYHRLSLGAGTDYALEKVDDQDYRLTCNVMLPDPKARCWLEWRETTPDKLVYQLWLEPTLRAQPSPFPLDVSETIRGPLALPSVHILDEAGMHEVPIPTS